MQKFKLANILLDDAGRAVKTPALYCKSTKPFYYNEDEACIELRGAGSFDFTTYFNACSSKKWRKYTVADNFTIHLVLRGASAKVRLMYADTFSLDSEPIEGAEFAIPASADWATYDFAFPATEADLIAFRIETDGSLFLQEGYYFSNVDAGKVRDVELALASTTFKKEEFVIPNIEVLKREILESDELVARHFTVHIVDNGRSLDRDALCTDRVLIHPNKNVGGSGGFTRGMIEAMRSDPRATHVLLMDDDVAVSPESIKRTYNLLALANDEYRDAFISGAMLNFDIPDEQWEDLGFLDPGGFFMPYKQPLRMTQIRDITLNESYSNKKKNMYAAWWYCCIPVSTIEREGLPLPLFIRSDDTEYGCRCHPKFITMNGICIWHVSFHMRYNAAVERYQTTRNTLIAQATTGIAPDVDFLYQMKNAIQVDLKKFNYRDAELALDGFEDFMKGPEFIMQDQGERLFKEKGREAEKLVSFEELEEQLDTFDVDRGEVYEDEPRSFIDRVVDFVTFNGQRLRSSSRSEDEIVVIPSEGWIYPAGKIRGAKKLLAIDTYNKKGVVRTLDKARFNQVWNRYKQDMREYRKRKAELDAAYAAARERLTSLDFWKEYLEID